MDDLKKSVRRKHKDLSDAEFEDYWNKYQTNSNLVKEYQNRIDSKIKALGEDYDLSDLKFNDMESLRALASALVQLEDVEAAIYRLSINGIEEEGNIKTIQQLNKIATDLRSDISKLQADLSISRKVRKSDKESSVIDYLESLKLKAEEFYKEKMFYVYCENCGTLLATVWMKNPEIKHRLEFQCDAKIGDEICGHLTRIQPHKFLPKMTNRK